METGSRGEARILQMAGDIGEIKGSVALLVKVIHGNGQPGLVQKCDDIGRDVATLKQRDSLVQVLKPHLKSLIRMGLLFFTAIALGAYGLVWAVAHSWPKLP